MTALVKPKTITNRKEIAQLLLNNQLLILESLELITKNLIGDISLALRLSKQQSDTIASLRAYFD